MPFTRGRITIADMIELLTHCQPDHALEMRDQISVWNPALGEYSSHIRLIPGDFGIWNGDALLWKLPE